MINRSPQLYAADRPRANTRASTRAGNGGSTRRPPPSRIQHYGSLPTIPPPAMPAPAEGRGVLRELTPYLFYLLLISTIGPLLFGYHLAELNEPSEVLTCRPNKGTELASSTTYGRIKSALGYHDRVGTQGLGGLPQCIPMDDTQFGAVSSLFTLGGLVGALAAGPLGGKYGRLGTMIGTTAFFTCGPILEALAPNIATITIGRFVSGLGAGAAMVVVPIYISEIAPPDKRGFFGSFTQVMVNFGILVAQLLGLFLSRGQLWRIIFGVAGAIGLAQGVGLAIAGQESPKWMAENGKPTVAKRALRKIRGHHADIEEEFAAWGTKQTLGDLEDEEETLLAGQDLTHQLPTSSSGERSVDAGYDTHESSKRAASSKGRHNLGMLAIFADPDARRAVFAVMMVMLAQQLCGINSIVMYGVSLLADLLAANSALLNVAVAALNVIITACAAPLVDKFGRKTCLLLSIGGMGTSSVLLAIGIMKHVRILSAVAVLLFVASFGLGLGPVPFILASELVNSEAVGATQSWALAANWIATFSVAQFFPMVNNALGKGQVYFIFAAFAVFFGAFVALRLPESKGKRDADEVWGRSKAAERED